MNTQHEKHGALRGLKVLDLSRILAGPWATQILGDLGAEVIKIEKPAGDDTRRWGPPFVMGENGGGSGEGGEDGATGDAAYFTVCNRNKKSVVMDLATHEGAQVVRCLAQQVDVVVENFRPGALKKYALDYESVRGRNPKVIYCSISGFGSSGPYRDKAGYDFLIQGMGGLMGITGEGQPVKVGVAVCDLFTGLYAANSILAAVVHRQATGEGQYIECALFDAQVAMLSNQASNHLVGGLNPAPMGNAHPNIVPYGVYPVADGCVIINCGNDEQFQKLCTALQALEIKDDPRFATNALRVVNRTALDEILAELLQRWRRQELVELLDGCGVPAGPINSVADVFADPQTEARGLRVDMPRRDGTLVPTLAYPVRLSATPARYDSAPPRLGEHTEDILRELGLD